MIITYIVVSSCHDPCPAGVWQSKNQASLFWSLYLSQNSRRHLSSTLAKSVLSPAQVDTLSRSSRVYFPVLGATNKLYSSRVNWLVGEFWCALYANSNTRFVSHPSFFGKSGSNRDQSPRAVRLQLKVQHHYRMVFCEVGLRQAESRYRAQVFVKTIYLMERSARSNTSPSNPYGKVRILSDDAVEASAAEMVISSKPAVLDSLFTVQNSVKGVTIDRDSRGELDPKIASRLR